MTSVNFYCYVVILYVIIVLGIKQKKGRKKNENE